MRIKNEEKEILEQNISQQERNRRQPTNQQQEMDYEMANNRVRVQTMYNFWVVFAPR